MTDFLPLILLNCVLGKDIIRAMTDIKPGAERVNEGVQESGELVRVMTTFLLVLEQQ